MPRGPVALGRPPRRRPASRESETRLTRPGGPRRSVGPRVARVDLFVRIEGVDLAEHPLARDGRGRRHVALDGGQRRATTPRTAGPAPASSRPPRAPRRVTVPAGTSRRLTRRRPASAPSSARRTSTCRRAPAEHDGPGPSSRASPSTATGSSSGWTGRRTGCGSAARAPTSPASLGATAPSSSTCGVTSTAGRRCLATGVHHLASRRRARRRGRPGASASRSRCVGAHHRLRVLPGGGGPGELHLGPPRADDELGAYGQERLRAAYAVDPRPTRPGALVLRELRRAVRDGHPARRVRGAPPSRARSVRVGLGGPRPRPLDARGRDAGRDRHPRAGTTCWARPGSWSPTPSSRSGTAGGPTSSSSSASTATRRRRWGSRSGGPASCHRAGSR